MKYRTLGTSLGRDFRNDLNANFGDIDNDIQTLGAGAKQAVEAAVNANDKAEFALEQGELAKTRLEELNEVDAVQFKDRQDNFDAQLAQTEQQISELNTSKASKGEVALKADKVYADLELFKKRDKNALIGMEDLTQEAKENMTGGSVAVVGVGAVGKVNMQKYAVGTNNTDFIGKTYNLANPKKVIRGMRINPDNGVELESQSYTTFTIDDVKPYTDYFINATHGFHRYNTAGAWISGTTDATGVRNTGAATKIKLSVLNGQVTTLMMVEGSSLPSQIEHGFITDVGKTQYQLKKIAEEQSKHLSSYKKNISLPFELIDVLKAANNLAVTTNRGTLVDEFEIRYKDRKKSRRIDITHSTSPITISATLSTPLDLVGVSEFVTIVYIDDVSKISSLQVSISGTSWSRQSVETLKNGWNVLRHQATAGDISNWSQASTVNFVIYFNDKTTVYLSDIFAIKQNKARILFINDHGYSNFKNVAYPHLKSLGIPTTWAINPGRLGVPVGSVEQILSQQEIDELAYDPYSEFSYHAWNPSEKATRNMTADELLEEHHKCITYLKKNGLLPKHYWRAAFTQNDAPAHEVLQPYLDGYATPFANGSRELYPFRNKYNINRVAIHGTVRTNASFDEIFDTLKKTRSLLVCYTHGLDDSGGIHMTNAQFDYFKSKIEQGVNEGWLEGTTYSKLRGQFKTDENEIYSLLL